MHPQNSHLESCVLDPEAVCIGRNFLEEVVREALGSQGQWQICRPLMVFFFNLLEMIFLTNNNGFIVNDPSWANIAMLDIHLVMLF